MVNRAAGFKCNWRGFEVEQPRNLAKNATEQRVEI